MTVRQLTRPAIAFAALTAIAACSKSATTTASAPTPAQTSSAPAASSAAARPSNGLPAGVTLAMVATGDSIFHARSCRNCHGADAKGRTNGPDLTSGKFLHVSGAYDDFVRIITTGVPADAIKDKSHPNPMRPRGGNPPLTDDDIKAVAAYVYSLNHK
jgi:mono/diheme cytochrome c family protein